MIVLRSKFPVLHDAHIIQNTVNVYIQVSYPKKRKKSKHTRRMKHARAELALPFVVKPHHPEWYHELALQMWKGRLVSHDGFHGVPAPEAFDSTLSEIGDDEDFPTSIRPLHGIDQWSTYREKVDQDLRGHIDTDAADWRFDLYRGWRLARKQLLGKEEMREILDMQKLPEWFWKFRDWKVEDSQGHSRSEVSIWADLVDDEVSEYDRTAGAL